jgi:hypothetical protein
MNCLSILVVTFGQLLLTLPEIHFLLLLMLRCIVSGYLLYLQRTQCSIYFFRQRVWKRARHVKCPQHHNAAESAVNITACHKPFSKEYLEIRSVHLR